MPLKKPIGARVLVSLLEDTAERKVGGLYVPDLTTNRPLRGSVIAVGEGISQTGVSYTLPVNPGDQVLFVKGRGTEIIGDDGTKFLLLDLQDILMSC